MPVIEFEGKNTEEAIEKACNQLHMSSDELKFEIVSTGSSGIFGLGSKKAVIKVAIQERINTKGKADAEATPVFERSAVNEPPVIEQRSERAERLERPERSERPGRGDRRDSRPRQEETRRETRAEPRRAEPRPIPEPAAIDDDDEDFNGVPVVDPQGVPLPTTVTGPNETVYEGPDDEAMTMARESLKNILEKMELEAKIAVKRISERVILNVEGENSGLLIGKKGATLDALQFVVNKIVNRTRETKVRIVVDTEDYRRRRHQSLIEMAEKMAEKAKKGSRPVTISALSAHDRRVVHLALQGDENLKTRSRGDGPYKNVVIIPAGVKRSGPGRRSGERQGGSGRSKDNKEQNEFAVE